MAYSPPVYILDPARAWPELPPAPQRTSDTGRALVGMVIALAYVLAGVPFRGACADITAERFYAELEEFCFQFNVTPERMVTWAESILLPVTSTVTPEQRLLIPSHMPTLGFRASEFQIDTAGWCAHRAGSVLALSCGVGKTFTSYAAAVTAARIGRCRRTRCHIIAPVNAFDAWNPYVPLLKQEFDDVMVLSVDSMHKYKSVSRADGGALIIDECDMVKELESQRTQNSFEARLAYEWCVAMTGTFLHAGAGGVIAIQDIACPGLSRFCNFWEFGEAFNCIITKQLGPRTRRKVGMPDDANFEPFVHYLNRGVKSLSFASPDVEAAVKLPGHTRTLVDTWPKPAWVLERQMNEYATWLEADVENTRTFDQWIADRRNYTYWLPELSAERGLAYLSLALAAEMNEMAAEGSEVTPEVLERQISNAMGLEDEQEEPESVAPSFAKILIEITREGRYDRCISRIPKDDGLGADYSFVYAEGSSRDDPAPGVKALFIKDWIEKNPGEPAVLGSVSSGGKLVMAKMLTAMNKKFGVIDGTVPKLERSRLIKAFQDGEIDYMVVQQQAGARSMTLTRAATSFLLDHAWSAIIYTQFLARTYRTGQKRPCEHYDLALGLAQLTLLRNLTRGEDFDTRVRTELENIYNNAKNIDA